MCGRYASFLPADAVAEMFRAVGGDGGIPEAAPSWNVSPSQKALVVRRHPQTGARHVDRLEWGLLPYFTKDPKTARRPINARAETVASSGMFRGAFARRRCLVVANVFYEWQAQDRGPKIPFAIGRSDGRPMAIGGIWESFVWPDDREITRSFAIITTPANAEMQLIHPRMPLIIEEAGWPLWLGEVEGDPTTLLRPAPDGTLKYWPVGTAVNSPRNNGPDLLQRFDPRQFR